MKIDVFAHILPEKYLETYSKKNKAMLKAVEVKNPAVTDIKVRLEVMNKYPDVLQVLTVAQPPLEQFVRPKEAAELARIANDELAELVEKYPEKFIGAIACLPMNDMDAALEETDRAINQLGLRGVQIYSKINGEPLDLPKFKPLYEKMANHDLPILIHPTTSQNLDFVGLFGWPFETASAMYRLVAAGTFINYPGIKFITHHCGGMVPYFEKRIKWIASHMLGADHPVQKPEEHFRKFYNDTAVYGSTPALMCGYAFFGADHILFGTDAPMVSYEITGETIASVQGMNIPETDKEKIFTKNAVNLLKLQG